MLRKVSMMVAVSAAAFVMATGIAAAQDTLKIGASAPKTGPLAGGAAVTHWPNIKLWVEEVNKRGGLKVGNKQMKVELIEYDDKTTADEAIKNITRLATVDKVDFIVTPYSTGINVATAPLIAKFGYPHITTSAATDSVPEFAKRWQNSFWLLGTSKQLAEGVADALKKLRDSGAIGKRVALVNVADAFGLELKNAGKPALEKAGFEIVYEASYPLGTQDVAPIISAAKAANPDAFVAFSYPPDTFALTEQAQIQKFDVGAFYVGVGTAFPAFAGRFKDNANGVMGVGGINASAPEMQDYLKRHKEVTGAVPDAWASATTYAGLEILGQAIERAGTTDKAKVIAEIRKGPFKTVIGEVNLKDGINHNVWAVGQWQDGTFNGVASSGLSGAKAPVKKQPWK
ncbi:amino acid ABC transporter substrate-binding protein [Pseudorhodoplanes sp.]|uniref:amino acid ABC transporter substrate-binding protein n=1 Tax=Pseudorhodoplanes sp. TaxID=1934341 RepID=UPI002D02438D|nr:amino acid ABC transporter substrate-binding protein [Pseudorhodoplanes sp.]HWV55142.1 amino acid ABC transporter substrate-binding protein [Pseudorhodoplanes sp.]